MSVDQNPLDPQTEYVIEESSRPGVPTFLSCAYCDVSIHLTRDPTVGVWQLDHAEWCPNAGHTPPDPDVPERLK